ncbi:flagellar biosynthesis anti-sigma factor FlgM [Candidatus Symbiobacter mobilis]|uniref:Negative regulator of flagellin synthesis n=1 Tax=Candidatus Symbiobacter mobilis CR TaxID=946483 RepID=U5NB00_9BURK|nr:flagellar biosynthesis anti-sigma factor FlgM [Candidatus Symbiobacter mobilis]AGX87403.1 flagellin synthesis negative regulator FlgM [Candidatus Symbiobacter mobilis CR]
MKVSSSSDNPYMAGNMAAGAARTGSGSANAVGNESATHAAQATQTQAKQANASTQAQTSATQSTQSAGVAVSVSTLARTMETGGASAAGDIDMKKVAAMREAISKGTFTVNAEVIADKLLAGAQESLRRARV